MPPMPKRDPLKLWSDIKLQDIGIKNIPDDMAQVVFKGDLNVKYIGQTIEACKTQEAPEVYYKADNEKLYTVLMIDPDAPTRASPKAKNWLHWVVCNIPGSQLSCGETCVTYSALLKLFGIFLKKFEKKKIEKKNHLTQNSRTFHVGVGAPEKTGAHRYVVLVFEQPESILWPRYDWLQKTTENRANWKVEDFMKKFNFTKLAAGACFRSEFDESVPKLYAEMKHNYEIMPRKVI